MRRQSYFFLILTILLSMYACREEQEIVPAAKRALTAKSSVKHPSVAWQQALNAYREGDLAQALGWTQTLDKDDKVYNLLGAIYQQSGQPLQAIAAYQKALQQRITRYGTQHIRVSNVYNNLGNVAQSQKNYTRAMHYYARALAIPLEEKDKAILYDNIGKTHLLQQHYTRAQQYFEKALQRHTPENQHYSLENLSALHRAQGHYTRAENYLWEALEKVSQTVGNATHQGADLYNQLAYLYYLQKRFDKVQKYANIAANITHRHKVVGDYTTLLITFINTKYELRKEASSHKLVPPSGDLYDKVP